MEVESILKFCGVTRYCKQVTFGFSKRNTKGGPILIDEVIAQRGLGSIMGCFPIKQKAEAVYINYGG